MCNKLVLILLFFSTAAGVNAANIDIQSNQNNLNVSDELLTNVTLTVNVGDDTKYFLRGVFFKPETSNYCGSTWNGASWFNGPLKDWNSFLPVTMKNSSWSGELKAKLDIQDSGCKDSGVYGFKIQRYTDSGSASFDSQNILTLTIIVPTSTPTVADTPEPTHTPKPQAPPSPTHTKKPDPTGTPLLALSVTPRKQITQTVTQSIFPSEIPTDTPVSVEILPEATPSSVSHKSPAIALLFVGSGLGILSLALVLRAKFSKTGTIENV